MVGWGLAGARRALGRTARRAGLPEARVTDLIIAANEILTNALIHGGGGARLRIVASEHALVCEVMDQGEGFDPSRVPSGPPDVGTSPEHGMGLWIARTLCDEVRVEQGGQGATVRMLFRS